MHKYVLSFYAGKCLHAYYKLINTTSTNMTYDGSRAVVRSQTWLGVLELLLLVVVHHDVRLHGDQLLLVELAQVQQGELVELLVAEEHLIGQTDRGTQVRRSSGDVDWRDQLEPQGRF